MTIRVLAESHHPVAFDPSARQLWCDVDLHFRAGPGPAAEPEVHMLTLMSASDILRELESADAAEAVYLQHVLRRVRERGLFIDEERYGPETPAVYAEHEYIDRAVAEKMLKAFMAHLGFPDVDFVWEEPSGGLLVSPL